MMDTLLSVAALVILVNSFLCFYRALRGPTIQDRLLGINIIGTKTLAILALVAYIFKSNLYLDIAMVYALLNFIVTIAVSRYLETEGWEENHFDS
ncbi:MAG: cation:proton antiporter [Chloroflexota bacterium]